MLLLSLLFLQLLNMHILQKPVFSLIFYCSTAMLSHTDSTILTVQLCQTFLAMFLIWGVWISLACLIQIRGWGKDWCFLKIFLSFLIDYTCFHARLSHHFITYIKGDLILVVFTFPSLSGLDRLFPCHYVFFIFFFSNRKKKPYSPTHIFLALANSFFFQGCIYRKILLYSFSNCLQFHVYALLKTAPELQ